LKHLNNIWLLALLGGLAVIGGLIVGIHSITRVAEQSNQTSASTPASPPPLTADPPTAPETPLLTTADDDAESAEVRVERMDAFEELPEPTQWPEPALIDDPEQWDAAVAQALMVIHTAAAGTTDQQLLTDLFAPGYVPDSLIISENRSLEVGDVIYFYRDDTATMSTARVNLATELQVSDPTSTTNNIAVWTVDLTHDGQGWLATQIQMDSIRGASNVID